MCEMIGLVMIIFCLAFFAFLFVCMLISFAKDKDGISFVLMMTYGAISLFFISGLFAELFGR